MLPANGILDLALCSYNDIKAIYDNKFKLDVSEIDLNVCYDRIVDIIKQNVWFVGSDPELVRDFRENYMIKCDLTRLQLAIISIIQLFYLDQTA